MGRSPGGGWPWTWVRLIQYVKQVRSVHERAAYAKDPRSALPPRWMWFENTELDKWFDERRK
jgi:hypothetical protein